MIGRWFDYTAGYEKYRERVLIRRKVLVGKKTWRLGYLEDGHLAANELASDGGRMRIFRLPTRRCHFWSGRAGGRKMCSQSRDA